MSRRAAGLAAVVALAAAVLSGSASARPPWMKDLALINRGLDRALAKGRIDTEEAGDYRGAVVRGALGPEGRHRRARLLGRHVVPGVPRNRLPVPPARELRQAEQPRQPEERRARDAARRGTDEPKRRPRRRPRLGVLLPLRRRPAAVGVRNGTGGPGGSA